MHFFILLQRREPSTPHKVASKEFLDCLHVEPRLAIQYPAKSGCFKEGYLAGARSVLAEHLCIDE